MEKLKVMISSVVESLKGERDALLELFQNEKYSFVELIGANPYTSASLAASSGNATVNFAKDCDLYILILGENYGMETFEGKSATEVEYDAALKSDPTKILVFLKKTDEQIDEKQQLFIKRVSDYYGGYFRAEFQYTHQLQREVDDSFWKWFIARAQVGKNQTFVDHFIRTIKEDISTPEIKLYYTTEERYAEITVCYMGRRKIIHVDVPELQLHFWETVNRVRRDVNRFMEER